MKLHSPSTQRPGLSLLEVLVAMAIFLFAIVAIGQIITQAGDQALAVQQQGQAIQHCQTKLAEIAAGAVPLIPQQDLSLDEDPDWVWSLDAQQGSVSGLWNVNVRVSRPGPGGSRIEASLSQMMLDPNLRGNNLVVTQTPDTSTPNQPNNSSSQSPSGSGGSPSGTGAAAAAPGAGSKPTTSQPAAAPTAPKAQPSAPSPGPKPSLPAPALPAPGNSRPPAGPPKGGT